MSVFDLLHVDGRICIRGMTHRASTNTAELTRAEVLALVRFAAELWPDQVVKVVHDAGVGAEAADLELRSAQAAIEASNDR